MKRQIADLLIGSKVKKYIFLFFKTLIVLFIIGTAIHSINIRCNKKDVSPSNRLAVIWSSGDPEVAEKVCLMYTHAASKHEWFGDVTLIIWGPSAKLVSENTQLQEKIKAMANDGVKLQACINCADMYGVTQNLRDLGVEVIGMGIPLSKMLKLGWKVITF